jgi:hypothetical protein
MSNKALDDLSYEDGGEDEEAKKDTSKRKIESNIPSSSAYRECDCYHEE